MKKLFKKNIINLKAKLFAFGKFGQWYQTNKKVWKSMTYKEQIEFSEGILIGYELAYKIKDALRNPKKYEDLI